MKNKYKIITLNIESDKHLDKSIPFLVKNKPDIICLQEVFKKDINQIASKLKMNFKYTATGKITKPNNCNVPIGGIWGIATLSKYPITQTKNFFYYGEPNTIPEVNKPNAVNRALLWTQIKVNNHNINILNTHFWRTENGESTPLQLKLAKKLVNIINKNFNHFILAGDFNAPKGRQTYQYFSQHFQNNMPDSIETTIDPNIHIAGNLKLIVDAIFCTPKYLITNVKTHSGVSDHQAISAFFEIKNHH